MDHDAADQGSTTEEPAEERAQAEAQYPAPPAEDGSAPVPEVVEVLTRTIVYRDVRCGRCLTELEQVAPEPDLPVGQWRYLQARGALRVSLSGGYGSYVDPLHDGDASLLLCEGCSDWLRAEVPGVEMLVKRLNHD